MHLQTADARMPIWKARNWDMWLVGLTGSAASGVASWWLLRQAWTRVPWALSYMTGLVGLLYASPRRAIWK
jgi:hypothetical protein